MTMVPTVAGRLWREIFDEGQKTAFPIRANVKETNEAYIVEAEMPGVNKEDIELICEQGMLTIGAKLEKRAEEDVKILRRERPEGDLRRRFIFEGIEEENISAKHENGMLIVTIPKEKPQERRISIE